jgi:hypothetical protein
LGDRGAPRGVLGLSTLSRPATASKRLSRISNSLTLAGE